jgi:hypothetical protein
LFFQNSMICCSVIAASSERTNFDPAPLQRGPQAGDLGISPGLVTCTARVVGWAATIRLDRSLPITELDAALAPLVISLVRVRSAVAVVTGLFHASLRVISIFSFVIRSTSPFFSPRYSQANAGHFRHDTPADQISSLHVL